MHTSVVESHPSLVICRIDFLKAIDAGWEGRLDSISFEKILKVCSQEDLSENFILNRAASELKAFEGIPIGALPLYINTSESHAFIDQALSNTSRLANAVDYLYGRNEHDCALNPVDEQYKFLTKGHFLFVGIDSGFVDLMDDKEAYRIFLTNCLEECRKSMQSPALTSSSLYRRFIFSNVNV